jgi:hypothetical protein
MLDVRTSCGAEGNLDLRGVDISSISTAMPVLQGLRGESVILFIDQTTVATSSVGREVRIIGVNRGHAIDFRQTLGVKGNAPIRVQAALSMSARRARCSLIMPRASLATFAWSRLSGALR